MRRRTCVVAFAIGLSTAATASPPARTRLLATGLGEVVAITPVPGDPGRIAVCQRRGRIRIVDTVSGAIDPADLVNITPLVDTLGDGGLLGLAFDPAFASNGRVFVFYNSLPAGDRVLARYQTPIGGPLVADPHSATTIWRYPRSIGHNGGWIDFSPLNGLLYLSMGDGGTGFSFDAPNRAQTIVNQLHGKMLRIDVAAAAGDDFPADPDRNYHVPATNPFVGIAGDDEIWSYGLRNPWRCSFDRATGDLYIADVGQDAWEEVNFEPAGSEGGLNYGWRCMEANACTDLGGCACFDPGLTGPIHAYDHADGFSITGGYVYRGTAIPALAGLYFFSDFITQRHWSFRPGVPSISELTDRTDELRTSLAPGAPAPENVGCWGEDAAGELYIADFLAGRIFQLVPYPCPTVIDQSPADLSVAAGQTAVFTALGAGTDPLTIRWRRGTLELADGGRIAGATTTTLTITGVQPLDAGVYSAVFTDACGVVVSQGAALAVLGGCIADFNGAGGVTVQDIFDFLAAYFSGDERADVNGAGGVTVQDIFDFLAAYFTGC